MLLKIFSTLNKQLGTTSHTGMNLANGEFEKAAIDIALILCFCFGAMITVILMPSNSFKLGGQYGPLFVIGSLLLAVACLIEFYFPESFWYFYLCAMVSLYKPQLNNSELFL